MGYISKGDYPDIKWVLNEWGEFPSEFSDNACRITSSHYFAKGEESFFQVVDRVVSCIAKDGWGAGYFDTHPDAVNFARRMGGYLLRQQAAFNSPVYYNVGVYAAPQCSACFIQSVEDDMDSILDLAKKEGKLFKHGSGTGTNLSTLRARGAPLSGGGEASGPVAFMHMYDAVASTIKSGGRTRRAAKMVLLDCDHPDISEFIQCKVDEDRKARKMIAGGMDPVEAYDNVKYQNGNHSVRLSDNFMRLATDITLGESVFSQKHSDILDHIAAATWECGDPGVQFSDTIENDNYMDEEITASNPCSEFLFLNETACNLASLNLDKLTPGSPLGQELIRDFIYAMDIIVDLAGYPTEEIAEKTRKYRPLGLGLTAVGSNLMSEGFMYGSKEACLRLETYASDLRIASWDASQELGVKLGSPWGGEVRNAQLTLMAPTGTISFMMDAGSTGIEPVLAETVVKHLSDGTSITMSPVFMDEAVEEFGPGVLRTAIGANPVTPQEHLDMMAAMQPYLSGAISKTINMPNDCTPEDIRVIYVKAWYMGLKCVAVYRDGSKAYQPVEKVPTHEDHLDMLDTIEGDVGSNPYITFDPNWAAHPYITMDESWDTGSVVGYVDVAPSTASGRVRLPDTIESITHKFTVGGVQGYLTVGLYAEGYPGEIFVNISKEGSTIGGMADAWATAFSMGLQYGVPLEKMVRKFKGSSFSPAGFTGSDEIRSATSIVDYIAGWLELHFLLPEADSSGHEGRDAPVVESREPGYQDGSVCGDCGKPTIRTGTCQTCPHCGWNGGCG
jgi:ribonucleoside-diphosphate reductase alpha chain